jgi:uncharacterized membrane protein
MKNFLKSQGTFVLFGLAFWLPIALLVVILVFLFSNAEDIGRRFLLLFLPQSRISPGFGIALGILVVYFSGLILKLTRIRKLLSKIPLLGLFFGGGEIVTIDRLLHLQPCLFLFSPSCLSYGWILSEEKVKISGDKAAFGLVNIYYPNVPALVTGQVFPVRKDNVIKLGNPSKEIIDLLLYAFRSPSDLKYLPWEEESGGDFAKRANAFGLKIRLD